MRETNTKFERISRQSEIKTIFATGRHKSTAGAKIVFLENGRTYSRFSTAIVRKFGTSVQRNRTKRIFREFYRRNKAFIKKGFDIIIVVYPGKYTNIQRKGQFVYLLKNTGLLENEIPL